ncbi:MAG: lysophospholipid acyltransferase family protein [Bacteroidota bacterium]|nr:lysophospholipid acyltransferase family protein [Bacteroidota bacterium]MDP4217586.1 lysophospholipid acyltransferase family protein [Bacteroidota bacterium]MDP4244755.1 lysophospholipid acyltransferase family protein [Bacteroidota bacterium]MDP4253756.1 lysophospholipid acyltransferase family protein [Bacteroidota bacterium]MDP4258207.1 lysophospholipid acyltransferase family protein [Bacteroidota bacterium]
MYYLLYGFLYLLSLLPMRLLYVLSDGIYLLVYYVFGYRKKVVMNNLKIAFPEKSGEERVRIAKKFYHHFIDSFLEVVKLLTASQTFVQKRFTMDVGELNDLYASGKSCQLHLGHTFNWEWGHLALTKLTPYQILVVYMPITNPKFEKLFYRLRTRSGNVFLPATTMRESITPYLRTQYLLGLVADQNPSNARTSYWLNFFGRPTPFASGPEKGARAGALPVVFACIEKPRRGYYHATVSLGAKDGSQLAEGELTLRYVRYLESVIRRNPDMWLWSHRRFKHAWKDEYADMWIDECMVPQQAVLAG